MIKRSVPIFFLYLVLTIILTWPLAFRSWNHVINAGDPLFYAWNLMHNVNAIHRGFTNALDANIYYPSTNTLAFSDTLAVQTLLMYPAVWLTDNPIIAINGYTLLTFPVAGLCMYLFVRSLTKHDLASIISGAIFAFSYPRFGQIGHLPALSSQWLPSYVYGLYWFLSKGKLRHLAVGLVSFLLLLGSSVYLGVYAILIGITMTLGFFRSLRARFKTAFIPLVPTAAFAVFLMYPYIRLKAEHPHISRSLSESSARAAYQQDWASVTDTSLLAGILKANEGERTLYPTIATLALAAIGISRQLPPLLFTALAFTGFILSFGPQRPFSLGPFDSGSITLPYAYLYKVFPLFQILRVPARFSIVSMLGLSVLAGLGASKIKRPFLLLLAILFLIEVWQRPLRLVEVPTYQNAPLVYQWLRDQPNVRAIVELPIRKIETGNTPIQEQVRLPYDQINEEAPLVTETYRVYFAAFHGKKTVNGYSGYVAQSYNDAVTSLATFPDDSSIEYLRTLGVTHILAHPWQAQPAHRNRYIVPPNHPLLKTVYATSDGDIVYEIR